MRVMLGEGGWSCKRGVICFCFLFFVSGGAGVKSGGGEWEGEVAER